MDSQVTSFIFSKLPVELINHILSFLKIEWTEKFIPASLQNPPSFYMSASSKVDTRFTIKVRKLLIDKLFDNSRILIFYKDLLPESIAYLKNIEWQASNNSIQSEWTFPIEPALFSNRGFAGRTIKGSSLRKAGNLLLQINLNKSSQIDMNSNNDFHEVRQYLHNYSKSGKESYLIPKNNEDFLHLPCRLNGYAINEQDFTLVYSLDL